MSLILLYTLSLKVNAAHTDKCLGNKNILKGAQKHVSGERHEGIDEIAACDNDVGIFVLRENSGDVEVVCHNAKPVFIYKGAGNIVAGFALTQVDPFVRLDHFRGNLTNVLLVFIVFDIPAEEDILGIHLLGIVLV